MADVIIPDLQESLTIDENSLFPIDSGIQTYKVKASNIAKYLRTINLPNITTKIANFTLTVNEAGAVTPIDSTAGSFTLTLPNPTGFAGVFFDIKDVGGKLSTLPVTLARNAAENLGGLAANYTLKSDFGIWRIYSNGTNWLFT